MQLRRVIGQSAHRVIERQKPDPRSYRVSENAWTASFSMTRSPDWFEPDVF
jgi:hypothetical protein